MATKIRVRKKSATRMAMETTTTVRVVDWPTPSVPPRVVRPKWQPTIAMMNPMYHLRSKNPSRARHWWIRTGTLDTNTAHTVVANLAAITTGLGDSVNSAVYWDGGHAVNFDSPDLIEWVGKLTGYTV